MDKESQTAKTAVRDGRPAPHRPPQDTGRQLPCGCQVIDHERGLAIAEKIFTRHRAAFEELAKR